MKNQVRSGLKPDRACPNPHHRKPPPPYSTVNCTVPVSVIEPDIPVTVITYTPAVVPALITLGHAMPPPLPPHAATPLTNATSTPAIPIIVRQLRRRPGMPISEMHASAAPPKYHGALRCGVALPVHPGEELAVVEIVSVAVPAVVPLIETGLVVPKLSVGGKTAFAGLEVMAAVSAMLPVKPFAGVSVTVDVFPVVAPAATETDVPVMLKLAVGRFVDADG